MSGFSDYLNEVFEAFGPIRTRRMFGGYGVYHDGVMFALVADDTLYLKADAETTPDFVARGLGPFEYLRQGKRVRLSYYLAPAEVLEAPEEARIWAERAYRAALRAKRRPAGGGR